jgi:hypothetical protein
MSESDLFGGHDGPLLSLAEAGRLLPGRGVDHPTPSCLSRWIQRGVVGADGRRHKLEAVRVGSLWRTTAAAVRRFVAATTAPAGAAAEPRSPGERRKASERAAAELARMGV